MIYDFRIIFFNHQIYQTKTNGGNGPFESEQSLGKKNGGAKWIENWKNNSTVENTFIIYRYKSIIDKYVDLQATTEN